MRLEHRIQTLGLEREQATKDPSNLSKLPSIDAVKPPPRRRPNLATRPSVADREVIRETSMSDCRPIASTKKSLAT